MKGSMRASYDGSDMWRVGGRPEGNGGKFCWCRIRGLKVNTGKSKVVMLNGEEGLEARDSRR